MKFIILGKGTKPQVTETAERLITSITALGSRVDICDLNRSHDLSKVQADITIVLGGDGAILRAARQLAYNQIPVLGINLGRLGFLADLSPEEAIAALPNIIERQFTITEHVMFICERRTSNNTVQRYLGLNEMILRCGPPFKMLDLELQINGQTVSRFMGDGLIISTPVGSTAHSLSAGGPILEQDLPAFVITPVCGHTLTNRPLVDSADHLYSVKMQRSESAWLGIDGIDCGAVQTGDTLHVRKAPVKFKLIKIAGKTYYQTLRDKLRWGTTPNYRHEPPSDS